MSRRTKNRRVRVMYVKPNVANEPVYACALWTPDGFAYADLIGTKEDLSGAGGLRELARRVFAADEVVITRGVR